MEFLSQISLISLSFFLGYAAFRYLRLPFFFSVVFLSIAFGSYFGNFFKDFSTTELVIKFFLTILLFISGLYINNKVLRELKDVSYIGGFFVVLVVWFFGFLFCRFLGFENNESLYLSAILSISSSLFSTKSLADKADLSNLYGRISLGNILVQNSIALLIVVFFISITSSRAPIDVFSDFIASVLKITTVIVNLYLFVAFILPRFEKLFLRSPELLNIFSIAFVLGVSFLFNYVGIPYEFGGLFAGILLASYKLSDEILKNFKSFRDLFLLIFIFLLSSQLELRVLFDKWLLISILILFVIIIKTFIVLISGKIFMFNKRINLQTGFNISTVSEVGLVILSFGILNKSISEELGMVIIYTILISLAISSLLVNYFEKIYLSVDSKLKFFDLPKKILTDKKYDDHEVILLGCGNFGFDFVDTFKKLGDKFLAIDFDPETIYKLEKMKVNCLYGDVEDSEFLDDIKIQKSKMIVSTIPNFETSQFLLKKLKSKNYQGIKIFVSYSIEETITLYRLGASYVIMPHFVSGKYVSSLAKNFGFDSEKYILEKSKQLEALTERESLGHHHPKRFN